MAKVPGFDLLQQGSTKVQTNDLGRMHGREIRNGGFDLVEQFRAVSLLQSSGKGELFDVTGEPDPAGDDDAGFMLSGRGGGGVSPDLRDAAEIFGASAAAFAQRRFHPKPPWIWGRLRVGQTGGPNHDGRGRAAD